MVAGSNPARGAKAFQVRSGHIGFSLYRRLGQQFWPEGVLWWFEPACLIVEIPKIIVHEGDEPNLFAHLFDSDVLTGEDHAEIDLLPIEADTTARGTGS